MSRIPLIISTDPGIDDVAAMTISFFAKKFDVRMVVPTWGNVPLHYTLENTLGLEKFLNINVPVVVGANQPLVRPMTSAAEVHGRNGLGGYQLPKGEPDHIHAGLAATEMANEILSNDVPVTLLGIGPLTDYALLLKQYPQVAHNINEIVIMGGNLGRGNYQPLAEYNIAGDPEAAQVVFNSGIPVKIVPLEIGRKTYLTTDLLEKLSKIGKTGKMLYQLFTRIHETDGTTIKIYDPTAVGLLLCPEAFTLKKAHVEVELRGAYTYGATVISFNEDRDKNNFVLNQKIEVAVDINEQKFANWFLTMIKETEEKREEN